MLIDGMNVAYRCFYAMPQLTNSHGQDVGAVLGFCNVLVRHVVDSVDVHHAVMVWDTDRGKTHRHRMYPEYKMHRPPMDDSLVSQLPILKDACEVFGVAQALVDEFEADDVIASLSHIFLSISDFEIRILSKDKDLAQLLEQSKHISLQDPVSGDLFRYDDAKKKYGIVPEKLGDVLALAGDAADNIPGVPGIGMKTAAKLVEAYGSLEKVYENIDSISGPKRRERLRESEDLVRMSRSLVTLAETIPGTLVRDGFFHAKSQEPPDPAASEEGFYVGMSSLPDPKESLAGVLEFCEANCLWDLKKRSQAKWAAGD
eukprot:g4285.t1